MSVQATKRDFIDLLVQMYQHKFIYFIVLSLLLSLGFFFNLKYNPRYKSEINISVALNDKFLKTDGFQRLMNGYLLESGGGRVNSQSNLDSTKPGMSRLEVNLLLLNLDTNQDFINTLASAFRNINEDVYNGNIEDDITNALKFKNESGKLLVVEILTKEKRIAMFLSKYYGHYVHLYINKRFNNYLLELKNMVIDLYQHKPIPRIKKENIEHLNNYSSPYASGLGDEDVVLDIIRSLNINEIIDTDIISITSSRTVFTNLVHPLFVYLFIFFFSCFLLIVIVIFIDLYHQVRSRISDNS